MFSLTIGTSVTALTDRIVCLLIAPSLLLLKWKSIRECHSFGMSTLRVSERDVPMDSAGLHRSEPSLSAIESPLQNSLFCIPTADMLHDTMLQHAQCHGNNDAETVSTEFLIGLQPSKPTFHFFLRPGSQQLLETAAECSSDRCSAAGTLACIHC